MQLLQSLLAHATDHASSHAPVSTTLRGVSTVLWNALSTKMAINASIVSSTVNMALKFRYVVSNIVYSDQRACEMGLICVLFCFVTYNSCLCRCIVLTVCVVALY